MERFLKLTKKMTIISLSLILLMGITTFLSLEKISEILNVMSTTSAFLTLIMCFSFIAFYSANESTLNIFLNEKDIDVDFTKLYNLYEYINLVKNSELKNSIKRNYIFILKERIKNLKPKLTIKNKYIKENKQLNKDMKKYLKLGLVKGRDFDNANFRLLTNNNFIIEISNTLKANKRNKKKYFKTKLLKKLREKINEINL